jgi:hypothetical protein
MSANVLVVLGDWTRNGFEPPVRYFGLKDGHGSGAAVSNLPCQVPLPGRLRRTQCRSITS